jgi:hypothetical protein
MPSSNNTGLIWRFPWWQADVHLLYQISLTKLTVIISSNGFSVCILALRTTCTFFVTLLILGDFLCFTVVTDWFPPLVFEPGKGAMDTPIPFGDTV